jgi:hypothetical protein
VVTTTLDTGEFTQRFPQVSWGKALLYTSLSPQGDSTSTKETRRAAVANRSAQGAAAGRLLRQYVPSGHLLSCTTGRSSPRA